MSINDPEVPETLELIAKLVASLSKRVDDQTAALAKLAAAQAQADARTDPDTLVRATAEATRRALIPELHKIVDTMEGLTGGKALLRERWRAFDREEARQGRWRFQPWAVVLGIPLGLGLLLAAFMPSAVAQTPLTCRAAGGLWWVQTERHPAACLFEAQGRLHQATGQADQADAGES